jgi:serine/threonine protein kinase
VQLDENVVVAGKFRLIRLLGRGGMGSVWQATHLALDIPCAVKFIEGDFAAVPEMQSRFQREAKAAAALRSPHVVQILDHDIWEGMPFIAMELLDGEELSKRIARIGPLPPGEVTAIIAQVCRALAKAHQLGVVHRDLKPDNLFLVRDDDREIVKILDFGIAKSKNPNLDIGGNTKTGAMLGTPYYMSPEQAQGNKAIDGRADLWALGVIAFECLTAKRPFESDALGDLLMQIMVKPLPMPSQERPGLPPAVDAWFSKACARDPKDRFQTPKELSEALSACFGQAAQTEVMAASEVNALMRGATMPLNTPNPLSTPNAAANTPYPGQGPSRPQSDREGPGAPTPFVHAATIEEAATPKKSMLGVFIGAGALVVVLGIVGIVVATRHGSTTQASTTVTTPTTPDTTVTTPTTATPTTTPTTTMGTVTPTAPVPTVIGEPTTHEVTTVAVGGHTHPTVGLGASATGKPNPHPSATATKGTDLGF